MLTITDYPKKIQWENLTEKKGGALNVQGASQKPLRLPIDEVVLQKRGEIGVKEDEYLVATYWG